MARVYSNRLSEYTHENGGRVAILFLLFALAIYQFIHAGFNAFAVICLSPLAVLFFYVAFKWKMAIFWTLIVVNWFVMNRNIFLPFPTSLADESLELLLIAMAIIDVRYSPHFGRAINVMFLAIMIWCGLCILEIINDTCGLGLNFNAWFTGFRFLALHLVWIILVFSLYISDPKSLNIYLKLWAALSLFSAFYTWKMINIGLTHTEYAWLHSGTNRTHLLNAGTLIRYWSTFNDAASYGCNASASAVAFLIFGITSKIKYERIFYLLTAAIVVWGMFQSGTRTAMITLIAGFVVYLFLARSVKILVPSAIIGGILLFILMFTNIGNGNQQIRRMRSAFKAKEDASANVRDINKAAIAKYMKEAPWGIGIGMMSKDIPANNKFKKLSDIPPDSEYVYIWVRTGPIGVTVFTCCMVMMLLGGCIIVLFRLKSRSMIGIGGGLCAAFVSIQLGGYANQILYLYPNGVTFFGGMAIVYLLPYIEPEWIKYEENRLAKIEEKKRLRLEKKLASRV
ncbi:MAG: O-antigen ligase family protein [Prevotella sp.]|nr:O-antigen ligase family protein [Prevotella sp.]